jgi:hypothetical protein
MAMVRCGFYFSDYRGVAPRTHRSLRLLADAMPKGWTLETVFRYKFDFLKSRAFSDIRTYLLYDNFRRMTGEEVRRCESRIATPFSTIRIMTKVGNARYPKMAGLPDNAFFANLVHAWEKFFVSRKIDVFIGCLTDDYAGLVGMDVARSLRIPTVTIYPSRFSNSIIIADKDYYPLFYKRLGKAELDRAYRKAMELTLPEKPLNVETTAFVGTQFNLASPRALARLCYQGVKNFVAFYFRIPAVERKMWLSTKELVFRQVKYFFRSLFARFLMSPEPRRKEKYVFFPLHFFDDATIMAKVPFINQYTLIENIARVLPHGTYLYIKPHPHWKAADMEFFRTRRITKLPNVRLLHYSVNSKKLIRGSEYVIIINSSVGFEALALGKKVVSFGNEYPADVIPQLKSVDELYHIDRLNIDKEKVRKFIANMYAHSIFQESRDYMTGSFGAGDSRNMVLAIKDSYEFIAAKK